MLNLPGAKGRAFSSAGTPSRAIQRWSRAGERERGWRPRAHKLPGPSALPAPWGWTLLWAGSVLPRVPSCTLEQAGIFLRSGGREGVSRREEAPG